MRLAMSSSDVSSHVAGKQRDNLPAKLGVNSGGLGAGGWWRGILAQAVGVPSSTSRDRHWGLPPRVGGGGGARANRGTSRRQDGGLA
jgi:hypothetical protein